ncbi:Peptidyl-prolyl cis-trans isomerase cyp6 [Taiwanofungus camphoratus]|nr:Peptidyl-prolyl cis-trans isomerase cyp6 [Antrodia cinnamomea]KAI0960476.1 Peptidyl-prolyl cis-trans isomerase cyp6 [Antrodia cinnamomea]
MSVLLETSFGDIVIDLEVEACPKTCQNFLKLCKVYYYNLHAFFNVSKDFLAQAGDPTAAGTGGECIWSFIASQQGKQEPRYFSPEFVPRLKHKEKGTVSMAVAPSVDGQNKGGCGSQFFITLGEDIDYLDGKHAVFGHVVEGLDTLDKLNDAFVDKDGRPFKDIRIRHIEILDDPFEDPPGLVIPESIPTRPPDNSTRIAEDEDPLATLPEEEAEAERRKQAARASALTLEMVGDLPFANVRPPENVLFVCKLNPVTRDEDLELIFSRFGTIMSCQVIRDKKTGDSLQYAFIEFDKREEAEQVSRNRWPVSILHGRTIPKSARAQREAKAAGEVSEVWITWKKREDTGRVLEELMVAMAWYLTSRMIDTICVGLGVGAGRPAGTVTPQESVENVQGLLGRGSVVTEIGVEVVAGIDARRTSITVNDKALVRMFPLVITVMGPSDEFLSR